MQIVRKCNDGRLNDYTDLTPLMLMSDEEKITRKYCTTSVCSLCLFFVLFCTRKFPAKYGWEMGLFLLTILGIMTTSLQIIFYNECNFKRSIYNIVTREGKFRAEHLTIKKIVVPLCKYNSDRCN